MKNRKKILILSYNADNLAPFKRVLEDSDFFVSILPNLTKVKDIVLKELPDLIVVDLDEIGQEEFWLCESLRNHPLSYKIPFFFLTPKDIFGDLIPKFLNTSDKFILKPFNIYMALFLINKTLVSLQKTEILASTEGKNIKGDFSQIPLTDLIQVFFLNKKSGLLTVFYQTDITKIYFHKGKIVSASTGGIHGIKAVFRLMALKSGSFEFDPSKSSKNINISMNTEELLLEGMRHVDEVDSIKETFPPLETKIFINKESDMSKLETSDVFKDIIRLCQSEISIKEVIDSSHFCDLDVYEGLRILFLNGIINQQKSTGSGEGSRFDPLVQNEEFFKIRKYFKRIQWAEGENLTAKLLILSNDESIKKDFINSIEEGFKDFSKDRKIYRTEGEFNDLGSFRITQEAFLSLCSFPYSFFLSPLWELLSSNRIGTILLLNPKKTSSLSELKEAINFLSSDSYCPVVYAVADFSSSKQTASDEFNKELSTLPPADILIYKISDLSSVRDILRNIIKRITEGI